MVIRLDMVEETSMNIEIIVLGLELLPKQCVSCYFWGFYMRFWTNLKHESCSILSLENFGSCFRSIGPIDLEIKSFS